MDSKEAISFIKGLALGRTMTCKYKGIPCVGITDDELYKDFKFISENHFHNPFIGMYSWYQSDGKPVHALCVKDANSDTIYQCNISDLEI